MERIEFDHRATRQHELDDHDKLRLFDRMLFELIGEDVAIALRRNFEGESTAEIAASLNVAESTMRTRMTRARTVLRRLKIYPREWAMREAARREPG